MLGALAHGVPSVVLPLFSFDQWAERRPRSPAAGAGITLDADAGERRLLAMPPADVTDRLAPAVERVLAEARPTRPARAGSRTRWRSGCPAADAALDVLEATAQTAAV